MRIRRAACITLFCWHGSLKPHKCGHWRLEGLKNTQPFQVSQNALERNFEAPLSQISLPVPGFCSNTQKPVAQKHAAMENSLNRVPPIAASPVSYSIITRYCTHCTLLFCPCLRTWLYSEIASDTAGCAGHLTRGDFFRLKSDARTSGLFESVSLTSY